MKLGIDVATPHFRADDDGMVTMSWPAGEPDQALITKDFMTEIVEDHNRLLQLVRQALIGQPAEKTREILDQLESVLVGERPPQPADAGNALRVRWSVTWTTTIPLSAYPDMTLEQAVQLERGRELAEVIELIGDAEDAFLETEINVVS